MNDLAGGSMPECNFTLRRLDPDKPEKAAWCQTHNQWAEACTGDPIDATLGHLTEAAKTAPKVCPHCGGKL